MKADIKTMVIWLILNIGIMVFMDQPIFPAPSHQS